MDVEKLIEDAERCQRVIKDSDCYGCHYRYSDQCPCDVYEDVIKLKVHYEQRLTLLREDINLLQRTMQTHKDVIADYKRQLEESQAMLKAERSKVVQEVREWVDDEENQYGDCYGTASLCVREMISKLDSMEPDKEDGE